MKLKGSSSLEATLMQSLCSHVRPKVRSISSEAFSKELSNLSTSGISNIGFIIWMKYTSADDTISLASMELSPALNTIYIYEQTYCGAFRIWYG